MKRNISLLTIMVVTALLFVGCDPEEDENTNSERVREIAVETIIITPDRFDDFIRVSGSVEALEDAMISSEVNGQLLHLANRGERVNRGDVIARIDDRVLRSNKNAAEAAYEFAQETFERLEPLYADSIVSTQDFRAARTERDGARAQFEQAEKSLQDTEIRAPFTGRVEERRVRTGELINPGMPVLRLVSTDRIRVRAGVPERYSAEIQEGSEVVVSLQSYGGQDYTSRVSFAGNVIDSDRRTFPIEIEMPNPEGRIKPEMVVNILVKRRAIENAIVVPRTAIVRDEDTQNLFVAREENGHLVSELVRVRTGTAIGPVVEVLDGLSEGDQVVVSGISSLSIGDRLNVVLNETSSERAERLQRTDRPVVTFD